METSFSDEKWQKFLESSARYSEWPVVEELGRPAGHTTAAIQGYIHQSVGSKPGDRLSQQYVTPDRTTAIGIIMVAKEMGATKVVIDSVYDTVAELELFRASPTTEYPMPLTSYPAERVELMKRDLKDYFEGPNTDS